MTSGVGGDGARPRSASSPSNLGTSRTISSSSIPRPTSEVGEVFQRTIGATIEGSLPLGATPVGATIHGSLPSATVHGTVPPSTLGQGSLSISSDKPPELLALCQKCKLLVTQAGKSSAQVKEKLSVNDLADLIMKACSSHDPRIELASIQNFSIAFGREKIEIEYNEDGAKKTASIDLTPLMTQWGQEDPGTVAFKKLYETATNVRGFEHRFIKGEELVAHARSAFIKTGSIGSRAAVDITGPLRLTQKDFLKKTDSRSQNLAEKIHEACGSAGSKPVTSLETHFKQTLARKEKILIKLMQKIKEKQDELTQAADEARKQQLREQIADLEKMKSFLAIEPIQEVAGVPIEDLVKRHVEALKDMGVELKVAIALMMKEKKESMPDQKITLDQKIALAQSLESIYLGQKTAGIWDKVKATFGFNPSEAPRVDAASMPLYISDIEKQNIQARYKRSAKQMAADTVALLFNLEEDAPLSLVKDAYKEFSERLQTAQEAKDIADVLFITSDTDKEQRAATYKALLKLSHIEEADLEQICDFS